MTRSLGRRTPSDWRHVERHPLLRTAAPAFVAERVLRLPAYRAKYDQGDEGSCVGFSASWLSSIDNRRFYDARWLYQQAQLVDEYADTPPADGTSVRAGMDVLRTKGHRRVYAGRDRPVALADGILENKWATTVDQVRSVLAAGVPVVLGVNWYDAWFTPVKKGREYWIGAEASWGRVAGGHAICAYGVSDRRQAVKLVNSWGESWPLVWIPYDAVARLLREDGEATMVTDR